jgi:hypothetical protein
MQEDKPGFLPERSDVLDAHAVLVQKREATPELSFRNLERKMFSEGWMYAAESRPSKADTCVVPFIERDGGRCKDGSAHIR